jgi:hypothetical protein
MILTREEKVKLVLDLYNEGKSTREIAQIAHMSYKKNSRVNWKWVKNTLISQTGL